MAWIAVGSAVVGGVASIAGSNKQAAAVDKATDAQAAGFNQYAPYVNKNLAGADAALDNQIAAGAYTGPTMAQPNDFQRNTANMSGTFGNQMMSDGNQMMASNDNFGSNYNDLYNKGGDLYAKSNDLYNRGAGIYDQNQDLYNQNQGLYGQNAGLADQFQGMSNAARDTDRLATANQYAMDNVDPLATAALRDSKRNLMENTLTGIDMNASGSGNMNSSRAGVAESIANRDYNDRAADTRVGIMNNLVDRSLTNQAQQFADQSGALTNVGNSYGAMSNNVAGSGASLAGATNALNAQDGYNTSAGNQIGNMGRANQGIMNSYNTGLSTMGQGAQFGMAGGNALQGMSQAQMDNDRANFERQRDYEMAARQDYQSQILGKAPSTIGRVNPNLTDNISAGFGGATAGYGFAQNMGYGFNDPNRPTAGLSDYMSGGPFSGYS